MSDLTIIKLFYRFRRNDHFDDIKSKMDTSLTIQAYAKAQNDFSHFMQSINNAIGEGINPEISKDN